MSELPRPIGDALAGALPRGAPVSPELALIARRWPALAGETVAREAWPTAIGAANRWVRRRSSPPSLPTSPRPPRRSAWPTSAGTRSWRRAGVRPSPPPWTSCSPPPANRSGSPWRAATRSCCAHSPPADSPPRSFPDRSSPWRARPSRCAACSPPCTCRWRSSGGTHAVRRRPYAVSSSSSAVKKSIRERGT